MLYETAARAEEILSLDAGDLDLPSKRGRVISKGGSTNWVHWQTGTALPFSRLLAGRREGPVFLIARRPARPVATGNRCPVTGRARLPYRRAEESFELATRPLANPGTPARNCRRRTAGPCTSSGTACPTSYRDVPQHVVQKILDHDSPLMTAHYAVSRVLHQPGEKTAGQQLTGSPERRSARPDASPVTWQDPAMPPSDA